MMHLASLELTSLNGGMQLLQPRSDLRIHLALALWLFWEWVAVGAKSLTDLHDP